MIKFLTLKHWQVFVLLFVIPFGLQIITIVLSIFYNIPILEYFSSIIMVLYMSLFFGWLYSLGTNLQKKLPLKSKMNLWRFKIFLFIPFIYIFLISVSMLGLFSNLSDGVHSNLSVIALIVPLHLFSMFCIFYCLYFVAKSLKAVELDRPVTVSDYVGEFFMLWFFPFGIWIIQPRINNLFDTTFTD